VDFYATFADLTHQDLNDRQAENSFSFFSVLNGDLTTPVRDHIVYLSSEGRLVIKKGEWKYIEGIGSGGFSYPTKLPAVKNSPTDQLYNMKEDVLERNNLFLRKPEIVKKLKSYLEEIVRSGFSQHKKIRTFFFTRQRPK